MRLGKLALIGAVAMASLASSPAFAADKDDVLAVVSQFNDGVNKSDEKAIVALCTDNAILLDMFAPYTWQGAGACSTWMRDAAADNKRTGLMDGVGTLGASPTVIVTGNYAYAAVPLSFAYKMKGAQQTPITGIWTFALQKAPAGWRVSGMAFGAK